MTVRVDDLQRGRGGAPLAGDRLGPGCMILVVGPSGAGKDSLIDGARRILVGNDRFHFARRLVTRPADPELEDHDSIDEAGFAAREAAGAFALSWRAHGLSYALPARVDEAVRDGATVIANVSRMVLDDARAKYADLRIVQVTATAEVLRERLMRRGRESAADIEERIARASAATVSGADVVAIDNSGALETALHDFLAVIGM